LNKLYLLYLIMLINTHGARFFGGQIDSIDKGFLALGHQLTDDMEKADLVYCNNAWYDTVIEAKQKGKIKGKVILNILDAAKHITSFPMKKLKEQVVFADAITTISQTVADDLLIRGNIESHVIYNPIKPVSYTGIVKYNYKYMFAGRVCDPEKRSILAINALSLLDADPADSITVGSESHGYGHYVGPVADEVINDLYNSVKFVLVPTRNAFLGLPIFEAISGGSVPVITNDIDIRQEFFGPIEEYAKVDPTPESIASFIAYFSRNHEAYYNFKMKLQKHFKENFEEKLSPVGVAKRIIDVYNFL